jgi:L-fucose isomerase-like protein
MIIDTADLIKRLRDEDLVETDLPDEVWRLRQEAAEALEELRAANMGLKQMLCKADPERYPPEDNL